MAQLFTIDKIEGNSNIGAPVFSRFGQMQNYNFLVLSPVKKPKLNEGDAEEALVSEENKKFMIKHQPVTVPVVNPNDPN